ncbi:MAG: DUF3987 domain-containing protein [Planctomycetaceae bacterium]|nr:DUF3987 domain-containing protein [Planctomycetaceae bacterium]
MMSRSTHTPEPIAPPTEPYQPFPVDVLPKPLRGFVEAGKNAIGCDPSYIALPLLTALGAAVGNTRRLRVKAGWLVPPILWTAIVGESGTSKTPAFRLALRAIRDRQTRVMADHSAAMAAHVEDMAHWEKAMAAWRRDKRTTAPPPEKPVEPCPERYVVSDTTVEALAPILQGNPRGVLLARDELAGWIGSFDRYVANGRGGDSPHWLSMHGGEAIVVDRKTGPVRTIYVPRAAVCVTGGIQPAILARALSAEHRESGLAARMLLAYPPRRAKHWTEASVDSRLEDDVAAVFGRLFEMLLFDVDAEGNPAPAVINMAPAAKVVWIGHYNAHALQTADREGDLAAAWSKLEEVPARLALILHLVRWAAGELVDHDVVDDQSMTAAVALGRWFCREAERVYDTLAETEEDRERRRLVDWIKRRGGETTTREALTGCRWLRSATAADAALTDLVRAGVGRWVTDDHGGGRGRPVRRFRLVSTVSVSRNRENQEENRICADADNDNAAGIDPNILLMEAAEEGVA